MAQALLDRDPALLMTAVDDSVDVVSAAHLATLYGVDRVPQNLRIWPIRGRFGVHFYNLRSAWAARRAGARLVLTRSVGAAAFSAMFGIPTVWECHAPPAGFERWLWLWLARSPRFRRLVVVSAALANVMRQRFPWLESMDVTVAHDGVDLARFINLPSADAAKTAAERDTKRLVAGYAGHLYAGRGLDVILLCAEALPHWDFIVAGGTTEAVAQLNRVLVQRGLNNVQLLGFVNNSQLAQTMAVCDVLLMPYQRSVLVSGGTLDTAAWMSPLKMFEYMAMNRAIISSDLPVLREVLDESCARLVPPDHPLEWVNALRSLETIEARHELAAAAQRAVTSYDWERRVELMLGGLLPPPTSHPCESVA